MVRDHPHEDVIVPALAVRAPRQSLGGRDNGEHLIGLVHIGLVLQEERDALEPRARINGRLVQVSQQREILAFALAAQVLIEHEVPDLEVSIAARIHGSAHGLGAIFRSAIVVDYGAGSRRPRLPSGPEDLFARQLDDVLGIQANRLRPGVIADVVVLPDGDPDAIAIKSVATLLDGRSQQTPRQIDGAFLEVVTEGEIAAHLEERTVTGCLAHVLDVICADALLNRGNTRPRRWLRSHNVGNEGDHAGDRKQNGRIRRYQRYGWCDVMIVLLEVIEPTLANLSGTHVFLSPRMSYLPKADFTLFVTLRAPKMGAANVELTSVVSAETSSAVRDAAAVMVSMRASWPFASRTVLAASSMAGRVCSVISVTVAASWSTTPESLATGRMSAMTRATKASDAMRAAMPPSVISTISSQ